MNNFFPRFSIVMDDTDDNELFVLICVGNALSIVGRGGKSLSYMFLVCNTLLSSHLDVFMFVSPMLSSSSSDATSHCFCRAGNSLSMSCSLWSLLTILFCVRFSSLNFLNQFFAQSFGSSWEQLPDFGFLPVEISGLVWLLLFRRSPDLLIVPFSFEVRLRGPCQWCPL